MEIKIRCKGADLCDYKLLVPFQGDLKSLTQENYDRLKNNIEKNGFTSPVHVWEHKGKKFTLDGHQRCRALRTMEGEGHTIPKIPIDYIEADSHAQAKRIVLAHTSQFGEIQEQGLYEFMHDAEISFEELDGSFNFPEVNFDKFGANYYENESQHDESEDDVPEIPVSPKTKYGDLYELGNHRLLCGDCTVRDSVARLTLTASIGMVFTDPPYGVDYSSRVDKDKRKPWGGIKNDDLKGDDLKEFLVAAKMHDCATRYICCNWQSFNDFYNAIGKPNNLIVWDKGSIGLGKGYRNQHEFIMFYGKLDHDSETNVWQLKRDSTATYAHPTQKPIGLAERAISNHKDAKNVLDIFGGSGSTLIACEKTKRNCYMMELDPRYCDVIVSRYVNYSESNKIKLNGKDITWEPAVN